MNWKHAANYVAKRYMEQVPRNVYFDDVRLQMDAKLWGEEYNRYNPPKKVCFIFIIVVFFNLIYTSRMSNYRTLPKSQFSRKFKVNAEGEKNLSRKQ